MDVIKLHFEFFYKSFSVLPHFCSCLIFKKIIIKSLPFEKTPFVTFQTEGAYAYAKKVRYE